MQFKLQNNSKFTELLDKIFGGSLIDPNVYICGGVGRLLWHDKDWQEHDVDLFFSNETAFNKMKIRLDHLTNNQSPMNKVCSWFGLTEILAPPKAAYVTPNAITYCLGFNGREIKVQCIKKQFYPSLLDVWNSFDFTCCQFAVDHRYVFASDAAISDCAANNINMIKNTQAPIKAARVLKYTIYGFVPSSDIMKNLKTRLLAGENLLSVENENDDIEY